MARPRAASDEEILAAAEDLAKEIGWQNVYAKTVHERMAVGGSLSTFSKLIKGWRASKEAEKGPQGAQVAEIIEDRASVLDDGLSDIMNTLKKLRDTVNAEIDRAVSDERRKSERLRADDKAGHDQAMEEIRARMEAMSIEIDGLVEEAGSEGARADQAEAQLVEMDGELNAARKLIASLKIEADKVPGLVRDLTTARAEIEKVSADAETRYEQVRRDAREQIGKAEAREASAQKAIEARDAKIDKIERSLSQVTADLSAARSDLTAERAERSNTAGKLKSAEKTIEDLKKGIDDERARADRAWDRVQELQEKITAPKGVPNPPKSKAGE